MSFFRAFRGCILFFFAKIIFRNSPPHRKCLQTALTRHEATVPDRFRQKTSPIVFLKKRALPSVLHHVKILPKGVKNLTVKSYRKPCGGQPPGA
jgi:hypothetical protein